MASFFKLRDSVSRKPFFLPKTGKTWRHSDVIYGWRIKASEFSFCRNVQNWWLWRYWKLGNDPYVTSGDMAEKREGRAKNSPHPVSRRLKPAPFWGGRLNTPLCAFLHTLSTINFTPFSENFVPRSSQVSSPGQVKWPYVLRILWCYSSFSSWAINAKLSGYHSTINSYTT